MAVDEAQRRRQVQELKEIWSRVSRQHLAAGQGCGCGFGGLVLQASDFEDDIVEFLINDAKESAVPGLEPFVEGVARRGADRYSLQALLDAIATEGQPLHPPPEALDFALRRLETTLSSIEAAHGGARFLCD